MNSSEDVILPGTVVLINNPSSIYNGYEGFVQRISSNKAAVLFDEIAGCQWEKLVAFPIKDLKKKSY